MTIACVYNDPAVRRHCLDRSIEAYDGPVEVEYLPVDNTEHVHTSAGSALNHAVRQATHDVVVLVHQDVYLHDLDRLAACADALQDERWGLLGANGVSVDNASVGRLRDRVILIGESAPDPVPVDTLDEVLLIARRDDLLREPLSESPELAWHAYAVEYSLRVRAAGRLAGAVDTAITHNSMTTNLARLAEAHHHVGALYPTMVPIHTTCGTVDPGARSWGSLPLVRDHGWRRRWLQQSRIAARVRSEIGVEVVLADIAHEVDLLGYSPSEPLYLLNADSRGGFAGDAGASVVIERDGRPVVMSAVAPQHLREALRSLDLAPHVLVTGLAVEDLADLEAEVAGGDWLAGVQWDEVWLVRGQSARQRPAEWTRRPAVPLGAGRSRG